jgi:RNA polymerase subunit RPABC4/transcription elongation factor Spt4
MNIPVSYEIMSEKGVDDMSFLKKITETVSKGVSTATEKAQQTVEMTRLNGQISSKRKEIDKLFANIGAHVYEAYLAHDLSKAEATVIPECEEITAIRGGIAILEDRIRTIRNEKECVCGKRVPFDTRFCPSCGHPFPEPEPEIVQESNNHTDPNSPVGNSADSETTNQTNLQEQVDSPSPSPHIDQRQLCKSCGTPLYADSHYCPTCGQSTR